MAMLFEVFKADDAMAVCVLCQRQAKFSGVHHFKCPLCNNADEFQAEMLKYGIYIPDQSVAP